MEFKDYYQTLELDRKATQDEIKRAYRKLARKYHPDVSKEVSAEDKFKAVSEAYEVLKDPEKRAAYDQLGANYQAGQDFRPPPDWDANFDFGDGGFTQGDASAFSDFFEQMFGAGSMGTGGFGSRGPRRRPARDHHAKILIDLEDAFKGASRTVTLQRAQVDEQGRVDTKPHTLNVKIPKGIGHGQQIRLKGQGETASHGAKGDLYLEIAFKPHPYFRVVDRDLEIDLPVTAWEAALGASVRVPTSAGNVELKIPPNSNTGKRLRLRGRGMPAAFGAKAGDLTVTLQIVNPPTISDGEKALFKQMSEQMAFNPREQLGVSS